MSELFYVTEGAGRPVVLLHGNGESHEIFSELMNELVSEFRLYAFDSPGHGRSPEVLEYHYREMAGALAEAIAEVVTEPAMIVGFSDGGILALYLAIDHPELVRGLVLCGTNTHPDGVLEVWAAETEAQYRQEPENGLLKLMLTEPDITDQELQGINVPTLVLAGEHDMIREEHTRHLAGAIPGAKLYILPGEDHGSYVERSTKLAPFIRELASYS